MSSAQPLEPVIGLEVHAQLTTRSKMFCACSAAYADSPPNTHVCAVCGGMPGALPVINRRAVEGTLLAALALDCTVDEKSKFDRKNYSYADLPKGYQISQFDMPIGRNGELTFYSSGERFVCGITRVHLEEDTGKTTHTTIGGRGVSLVDLNRSGVPLMEIVSKPELYSPESARAYFEALRQILMYLGVCDGNLQEGSMRADVNVSLRPPGGPLGTKVEVKNLNSFRAVQRALEYEIERQSETLARGEQVQHETRGWSEEGQVTLGQRTKEFAHDYRYFPEPDLPYLHFDESDLQSLRAGLPELPFARFERLQSDYGITAHAAGVLTAEAFLADFFEAVVAAAPEVSPHVTCNWVLGETLRLLKESSPSQTGVPVSAGDLGALLTLMQAGTVSNSAAKTVLEDMFATGEPPGRVLSRLGLERVGDEREIETLVAGVLAANPSKVDQFRAGKEQVAQSLFGDVMKASKGKADPRIVRDILNRLLREAT